MIIRQIRQATRQDRKKVENLRISEFNRSTEFTLVQPEKLLWSKTDDKNIVLLIQDDKGAALSTMRGITVQGHAAAENLLKCTVPQDVRFPVMIFTSAATLKPFRRRGFNQLLRLYLIKCAMNNNIETLISPVYQNAPRIQLMASLGYEFIIPEKNWQKKLNHHSERQLGILTSDKFKDAIAMIEQHNAQLIGLCPWHGGKEFTCSG